MGNGSMVGKFQFFWVPILQFPRLLEVALYHESINFYLDFVHVDITFGDCVLVGGFCYTLIFVDWATRYN